ncbi:MAG TPA: ribosome silencing factor [Firmicutes bacterium]|jgi:ribosome-associated protein|nr:ribosome silencing factor [Bacillota bacterium]
MSEDRILKAVVATIQEKKGDRPVILDLREVSIITDYFVVAGGQNPVHLKALADAVEKRLKEMGVLPQRIEGYREGGWILMDYGALVVHLLGKEERDFYRLEHLWHGAKIIEPAMA